MAPARARTAARRPRPSSAPAGRAVHPRRVPRNLLVRAEGSGFPRSCLVYLEAFVELPLPSGELLAPPKFDSGVPAGSSCKSRELCSASGIRFLIIFVRSVKHSLMFCNLQSSSPSRCLNFLSTDFLCVSLDVPLARCCFDTSFLRRHRVRFVEGTPLACDTKFSSAGLGQT